MFGLINQLFKGFLMFGFPLLMAFGVWIVLEPATFWQTLTTLIVSIVVCLVLFVAICLILNDLGDLNG